MKARPFKAIPGRYLGQVIGGFNVNEWYARTLTVAE
jgi:hypothetical protein